MTTSGDKNDTNGHHEEAAGETGGATKKRRTKKTSEAEPAVPVNRIAAALNPRGLAGSKSSPGDVDPGPCRMSSREEIRVQLMERIPFQWIRVYIQGLKPLLVNKAREDAILAMEDKQQGKAARKKPPRIPVQEFVDSSHICVGRYHTDWIDKNVYGFPVVGIKKAAVAAAYRFGDAANKVSNMGSFFIHGPYDGLTPIVATGGPQLMEVRLTTDRREIARRNGDDVQAAVPTMRRDFVVIPAGRTASIAYRPQFFPWSMELEVKYCPNFISRDSLIDAFHLAGQCIGIGSWRVENGGEKGQFEIAGYVELSSDYEPTPVSQSVLPPMPSPAKEAKKNED